MKKTLRAVCKDHKFLFDELLEKGGSCKIHERNLQKLVMKTFKVKTNLAPRIKEDVYEFVECSYSLKYGLKLKSRKINSLKVTFNLHLLLVLKFGTVYLVALKSVNPLNFSSQKSKRGFLKAAIVNFVKLASTKSTTY